VIEEAPMIRRVGSGMLLPSTRNTGANAGMTLTEMMPIAMITAPTTIKG
jgi:hypothetical protein